MIEYPLIDHNALLTELSTLGSYSKSSAVRDDIRIVQQRIRTLQNLDVNEQIKNDYYLCVQHYIQAADRRRRYEQVSRYTHLPKTNLFKIGFLFVYDNTVEKNYMAPAVEPMRDFLAISAAVVLPHEVQIGIFDVLVVGCALNKSYMHSKNGVNEKTEATLNGYCEDIDRMVASALALSLKGFFL